MEIRINNKEYKVKIARTQSEKEQSLQGVSELPKDLGMLFVYDEPLSVLFWMKNTLIPLDIIFIDEEYEVISVKKGTPLSEKFIREDEVSYVLELNYKSGVRVGDKVEFEEEDDNGPVMKVLNSDGSEQYSLWGGERIISRKETKVLIRKAKKAELSKSDTDYKSLGKYIFKVFKGLDERTPEYVEAPE